jgi:predicted permease
VSAAGPGPAPGEPSRRARPSGASPRTAERIFALLVLLFPGDFRRRFGADMRELFRDQLGLARRGGAAGVARLWLRVLPSLAWSALLEHRDARAARRLSATLHATGPVGSDGMLATLTSDLRYAVRMLRKSPVFTLVAVLVIALGSGAVTTIFSGMNGLLLRPLPAATDPERLVAIERRGRGEDEGIQASYPYYAQLRDRTRTLDGVAAWSKASLAISSGGEGSAVYGNIVSGNYFSLLGVRPALGRFFLPEEDRTPLTHPVVVVSHAFWRTRLGADSAAVGRALLVNGRPYTLVGVAPEAFRGVFTPLVVDAWVPLMMQPHVRPNRDVRSASFVWLWTFGRMKDGVTRDVAAGELTAITAALLADGTEPEQWAGFGRIRLSGLTGLPLDASRTAFGFVALLLGASALVLLIAGVNVAALLSARAIARRRELAVRAALGAARGRLVRQLLTESLLLFLLGAAGGLALAVGATHALERMPIPTDVRMTLELSPDLRVLAFALLLSLATGIVFGLAPAVRATRQDITARLRGGGATGGPRRAIASNGLVVGQLALSLVLLVGAGLFLRALRSGQSAEIGFERAGVATAAFNAESWGYDSTRARLFYAELRERLEAVPGVEAVSFTDLVPLTFSSMGTRLVPDGAVPGDGDDGGMDVRMADVDAGYFDALRLPLARGRAFTLRDDASSARVVVINETLARRLAPAGDATGRSFRLHDERWTVIGVALDARYADLGSPTPPVVYLPMAQNWRPDQTLLVRTSGDAARLAPVVRAAVRAIDPTLPPPTVMTLAQATSLALLPQRVAAMVTGALGTAGLLLATVGLYGIIAYSVSGRTRELGIRVALGARRADVLGLVVREGMWLAALGVAVGLLLAAGAARLLGSLLLGVSPLDLPTFAGMSLLFVAVALLASWLPARRAAATDPTIALRAD